MTKARWTFAIEPFRGDLHILPFELPPAENLVVVEIDDRDGVHVIRAEDARALRDLLGTPSIKTVIRHTGPHVVDELESLLEGIEDLVRRRIARNRPESEDDEPSPP